MTYRMTLSRIAWVLVGVGLALIVVAIVLAVSASAAQAGHRCHTEHQCRDRGWAWHGSHSHHTRREVMRSERRERAPEVQISDATPAPRSPGVTQPRPDPAEAPGGADMPIMLGEFLPAPIPDMFGSGIGFIPPAAVRPLVPVRSADRSPDLPAAQAPPAVLRSVTHAGASDSRDAILLGGLCAFALASVLLAMFRWPFHRKGRSVVSVRPPRSRLPAEMAQPHRRPPAAAGPGFRPLAGDDAAMAARITHPRRIA